MDTTIINWEECIKLAGNNINNAKEFLKLLADNLKNELEHIKQAHQTKNTKELKNLIHKIQGALCYCSLPRLKSATIALEISLKNNQDYFKLFQLFEYELNQFLLAFITETYLYP